MGARKSKITPHRGETAPEWFYPFARLVHERARESAQAEFDEGLNMGAVDEVFAGQAPRHDAFRLVGTTRRNVYMSGIIPVSPDHVRRYKLRIPRSRFDEFTLNPAQNVNSFTDNSS